MVDTAYGRGKLQRSNFSFRLRLTFELYPNNPQSPLLLRGSLQRLDSDQVPYFSSLAEIPPLIAELTSRAQATGNQPPEG